MAPFVTSWIIRPHIVLPYPPSSTIGNDRDNARTASRDNRSDTGGKRRVAIRYHTAPAPTTGGGGGKRTDCPSRNHAKRGPDASHGNPYRRKRGISIVNIKRTVF